MLSVQTWITIVASILVFAVLVVAAFHYKLISLPSRGGMDQSSIQRADEAWENLTAEQILQKARQSA